MRPRHCLFFFVISGIPVNHIFLPRDVLIATEQCVIYKRSFSSTSHAKRALKNVQEKNMKYVRYYYAIDSIKIKILLLRPNSSAT